MAEVPATPTFEHIPVLGAEIVQALSGKKRIVDGTLGLGGHSELLLSNAPDTHVIGVEWDAQALEIARARLARFGNRFQAIEGSYADLPRLLEQLQIDTVDGLVLDLGLSSMQLQDSSRGFSFLRPGPLDMRMSRALPSTAWDLLRSLDESQLAKLFLTLGEEPRARRIAHFLKKAVAHGTLQNDAWQIATLIREAAPVPRGKIDPATRCFQALRIAVNHELDNIDRILAELPNLLAKEGRAAIIAFHSLEDRRVKTAFHAAAKGCVCPPQAPQCVCGREPWGRLVPRKAIQASPEEVERNPRSRSARLRVLERL